MDRPDSWLLDGQPVRLSLFSSGACGDRVATFFPTWGAA